MHQLPELARLCRRMGVDKLWTDRVVPIGRGKEMADLTIRREDLPAYLDAIRREASLRALSIREQRLAPGVPCSFSAEETAMCAARGANW